MSIYEEFLKKGHKVDPVSDFRELVYRSEKRYGNQTAFHLRDRKVTYKAFADDYRALVTAFIDLGYKDKSVAIVGANSYGWILSYLGAATVGVAVPIDKELSSEDIVNFINEAGCTAVIGDENIISKLDCDIAKYIISAKNGGYEALDELLAKGAYLYAKGNREIDTMPIDADEMSILIFTSGTTGNSKGVCLAQKNICANINQTSRMVKIDKTLHSLSVLPLHHTYETTLGHLLLLSGGSCISYCDGLRHVAKNIGEYRPSVLIVVPLLLEFILKRIKDSLCQSLPKRYVGSEEMTVLDIIKGLPAFLRFIVKRKVKKSLGGRLRLLIVGAAPIRSEVIETFYLLGIATYQGYGLTETSPLIAGNNDFYVKYKAVGLPIHGVEIKIENPNEEGVGEVICKGDNVMLGYYNDPEGTKHVMRGGYFHTGDLGFFDKDGFLYLTGRCKNVIVAQNGKNIYPEELEARLSEAAFVSEAFVLGVQSDKGGTTVKAKIFPDLDKIKETFNKELSKEEIRKLIADVVEKLNEKLPLYKKIIITEIVWEAFEKTTTKKIKRFGANAR